MVLRFAVCRGFNEAMLLTICMRVGKMGYGLVFICGRYRTELLSDDNTCAAR